jgi:hypothetical protein
MLDLMTLPAPDAERLAYAEGFEKTAALFARIDDLQRALGAATAELTDMQRRLFEADEQTDAARIERDMEQSRADEALRNADVMHAALMRICRGGADARQLAADALEALE